MAFSLIISCEHAGSQIPDAYLPLFENTQSILQTHEGWDPGAWKIATALSTALHAPLFGCHINRLLVEANRSLDHPQLFSRFTQHLDKSEKEKLINEFYLPYRQQVENEISNALKPVLHLSIHSFTPLYNGVMREVDIGLLFDPQREPELLFCEKFQYELNVLIPNSIIQFNKPYLGIDDGFTTYLRSKFKREDYLGIEIEVNQKLVSDYERLSQNLFTAFKSIT